MAKKLNSLPYLRQACLTAGRQNSKVNFKNQFQKTKGRENLTTMLYYNKVKSLYRFFFYYLCVKNPFQFPNIHLTKKPRTSYVTISKNQCNPWQKNLTSCRQAGKIQKSILKVNFKKQFQKTKGRDNLTTMLYSSSVKKVCLF